MGKIDCTPEEKIHRLLIDLKKNSPELYEPAKRVLKFLYKTVNEDFFDKAILLEIRKEQEKESFAKKVNSARKNLYVNYIEEEETILDNFIKIVQDDPKYFNKFYEEIEPFLEMTENHLYSDYEVFNYVFNIYVMLKSYELSKGDFDAFSKFVSEFSNLFISSRIDFERGYSSSLYGISNQEFVHKQDLIDQLIELKLYKENTFINETLREVLDEINLSYNDSLRKRYLEVISDYKRIYELSKEDTSLNKETIIKIEDDLKRVLEESKNRRNSYHSTPVEPTSYFSMIVLFGERYDYLKNSLSEVEPSLKFKKDILSRIEKLDYHFFEFLNKELEEESDSFITCMKSVFDSDTYFELLSKMSYIQKASEIYKEDSKLALQLINTLNDDKHKEEIQGVKMAWPKNNSINKPNKPKTILDRTIALHRTLPNAPDEKFYREKQNSSYYIKNIREFVESINEEFKRKEQEQIAALKKQQEEQEQPQQEPPKKVKGLGGLFKKNN